MFVSVCTSVLVCVYAVCVYACAGVCWCVSHLCVCAGAGVCLVRVCMRFCECLYQRLYICPVQVDGECVVVPPVHKAFII